MNYLYLKTIAVPALLLCTLLLSGAEKKAAAPVPDIFKAEAEIFTEYGLKIEPVEIGIPGLKRSYTFVWLSDLHVIADDISEVAPKSQQVMAYRRDKRFNNPRSGKNPAALWRVLPRLLNNSPVDAVFLGGDICDMGSAANLTLLKQGLEKFKKPFIFLREDHDYSPWHLASKDMSKQKQISREIDGHSPLPVMEFDDLMVVGLDYSVRRISKQNLALFKKYYAKGKPMIVLIHVPIMPPGKKEAGWMNSKRHIWGGRMKPYKVMGEFIRMLSAPGTLVKGVFSGHSHRTWDGWLAPGVKQHVFAPAFEGVIGIIKLYPAKSIKK